MKRRALSFSVIAILILTMLLAPLSASAAGTVRMLKVNADYARLRSGPGSSYDVIRNLGKGERVFYMEDTSNYFCRVRTQYGETGYVYRGYLNYYGAVRENQIYVAAAGAPVYQKIGGTRLGTLPRSGYVIVGAVNGAWACVKNMKGKMGFIETKYLKKAN